MTKSLFLDWMMMMYDFYFFPATFLPLLSTQPGEACTDTTQGERDKQKYLTTSRYLGKRLTTHVACHMDWIYCFFFVFFYAASSRGGRVGGHPSPVPAPRCSRGGG